MAGAEPYGRLSPLKRALLALDEMKGRLDAAERSANEPIAIVGLGCRVPGADNPEAFWTLLRDGRCTVGEVPSDRWDVDEYYDPDPEAPGKMSSRRAAFLERIDLFDAEFFGISPREAQTMDPQQRLFLEVCWEALEHAGVAPDRLSGTATGVFAGVAAGDYADLLKGQGPGCLDGHFASGVAHSIVSGRVSYILGLQGPSISIDTACSSSLVAVHLACQSLRAGECRIALAGGVSLMVTPDNSVLFSKARMLAADGRCKTFDAAADGFGRGEGAAVVVLKRLSGAAADGDRILAVIRGSAVNQDGPSSGLTAPNGPAQEAVIVSALGRAGLRAGDVDVVEAHGTGTPLGDPIEVQALGAVHRNRPADRPLALGSVKANIGHLEAAAGCAGLIKLVLALQHEAIPPHPNLHAPNPHIAWDELPLRVVTSLVPWPRGERRRIGGVSSFGFSGTNAHVIVEEGPVAAGAAPVVRTLELVTLSARTGSARQMQAQTVAAALRSTSAPLGAVARTLNTGRAQLAHRAAVLASSEGQLLSQLDALAADQDAPGVYVGHTRAGDPLRVGLLFTGQGAQYAGMARELYDMLPAFRRTLDRCDELLGPLLERPLLSVLFPAAGESSPIDDTGYTQPALFAVDYSLGQLWLTLGLQPYAVMGHSLGEFAAACLAGVFSLEDACRLVAARGRLMQQLPANGAMASVFADEAKVARAIADHPGALAIAAVNEPAHVVISGERSAVDAVVATLGREDVRSRLLTVSHAFHSPLMAPMLDEFGAVARTVSYSAPRVAVISNVTGKAAGAEIATADYWVRHVMSPVRFADGVAAMAAMDISTFVECGPHPTLLGMASRCDETAERRWLPSLRKGQSDWARFLDSVAQLFAAGARLDLRTLESTPAAAVVALPTYPFERLRCWPELVASVRRVPAPPGQPGLLPRRTSIAGGGSVVFEGTLDARTGWFADHRVHGTVILPGAAFVEIGFAAAQSLWGAGAHTVDALLIHRALPLDEAGATLVQAVITERSDTSSRLQIFSAAGDESSPVSAWTLHAEGRLSRGNATAEGEHDRRADADARCVEAIDPAAVYAGLQARGLVLGGAFQGLREVRRGIDEACATIELPAEAGSSAGYCVHPILIDLGIQTLAAALVDVDDPQASYLPLSVERASRDPHAGPATTAHARRRGGPVYQDTIVADVRLLDANGRTAADLHGLRLKRTEPAADAGPPSAIGNWLYDIEWRGLEKDVGASVPPLVEVAERLRQRVADVAAVHNLTAFDAALPQLEALSTAFVVEALDGLGAPLQERRRFREEVLARDLGIVEQQRRLFGRLLEILAEEGILARDGDEWRVARTPERPDTARWLRTLQEHHTGARAELALVARCGPALADALTGRVSPLSLLFPDGSTALAEALYQASPAARAFNQLLADAVGLALGDLPAGQQIRVLEIGGGTGATTSFVLPRLNPGTTDYLFTDVSPAFTALAAARFAEHRFVRTTTLDIERAPAGQGVEPGSFDLVIAANVLHATRDLGETFAHVRSLTAPGGLLVMLEMVRPQRWIDVTFGLTDGWWRFTDRALRPGYPLLGHSGWQQFLTAAGFTDIASVPGSDEAGVLGVQTAILARRTTDLDAKAAAGNWLVVAPEGDDSGFAAQLEAAGHRCTSASSVDEVDIAALAARQDLRGVVYACGSDASRTTPESVEDLASAERRLGDGLLRLVQALTSRVSAAVPLTIVTRGGQACTGGDAPDPVQATLWGMATVIALEHPELSCRRIDIDGSLVSLRRLVGEVIAPDREDRLAFRSGRRFAARLSRRAAAGLRRQRPARYRFDIRDRGAIDRLEVTPAVMRSPGAGEIEIRVAATALNFRDVLNVLGMYPGDPGPLGSECVGTVTAIGEGVPDLSVGDQVVGIMAGSLASHATGPAIFVVRLPESLTPEQAVTVPVAYTTAEFALGHRAGIRSDDRVLIHAAAGGVGLAAVHIAMQAGAEVFATAGSPEKRAYLRSLGVTHVYDSRTLDFADGVRAATGGRGVTVVLNSLSGAAIGASLEVTADGGRFLEIGKSGWSAAQVAALDRRIAYHVIDWSDDARRDPALIRGILTDVLDRCASGVLPALPLRAFDADEAHEAFRFMAQARHIGKVLITHPDCEKLHVDSTASYLVTGGLSGLGLATAEWLAGSGARSLVLMSRGAPDEYAAAAVARLRESGAAVQVVQGDVAREADVRAALAAAGSRLRGIVHAAGVLQDGMLVQQQWPRFAAVLAPKTHGAHLLDRLTAALPLDFFVMFSSIAAVFGSRGQANHAAANAALDALAHRRRSEGRAALSINWGVWSGVGAAVRHGVDRRSGDRGIGLIDPASGLAALQAAMRTRSAQLLVCPVDWPRFVADQERQSLPPLFDDMAAAATSTARARPILAPTPAPATPALLQQLQSTPEAGRPRLISSHLRELAGRVLGLPANRGIDPRQPLSELGLDSLMAVELRNVVGAAIGRTLPATLLFDFPTLQALGDCLARELGVNEEPQRPAVAASAGRTAASVLDGIDDLSDQDVERLMAERRAERKKRA